MATIQLTLSAEHPANNVSWTQLENPCDSQLIFTFDNNETLDLIVKLEYPINISSEYLLLFVNQHLVKQLLLARNPLSLVLDILISAVLRVNIYENEIHNQILYHSTLKDNQDKEMTMEDINVSFEKKSQLTSLLLGFTHHHNIIVSDPLYLDSDASTQSPVEIIERLYEILS